ncbi:MAG: Heterodimeric efflux ABC transporter, permease/ATP-binding subunit 2, partial [uncultured Gemmatimonadetes bacterium]
ERRRPGARRPGLRRAAAAPHDRLPAPVQVARGAGPAAAVRRGRAGAGGAVPDQGGAGPGHPAARRRPSDAAGGVLRGRAGAGVRHRVPAHAADHLVGAAGDVRPAHRGVFAPSAAVAPLLRPQPGRAADDAGDQRRGAAERGVFVGPGHGVRRRVHRDLHPGADASAELAAGAGDLYRAAAGGGNHVYLPLADPHCVPRHPRAAGPHQRLYAGARVRLARGAALRARAAGDGELQAGERRPPGGAPALHHLLRPVLSHHRGADGRGPGADPVVRRRRDHPGRHDGGGGGGLSPVHAPLLPPHPGPVGKVQHPAGRHGGVGANLRAAGHGAGGARRRRPTPSSGARAGRDRVPRRLVPVRRRRRVGAAGGELRGAAGGARGHRRSDRGGEEHHHLAADAVLRAQPRRSAFRRGAHPPGARSRAARAHFPGSPGRVPVQRGRGVEHPSGRRGDQRRGGAPGGGSRGGRPFVQRLPAGYAQPLGERGL